MATLVVKNGLEKEEAWRFVIWFLGVFPFGQLCRKMHDGIFKYLKVLYLSDYM